MMAAPAMLPGGQSPECDIVKAVTFLEPTQRGLGLAEAPDGGVVVLIPTSSSVGPSW